MRVCVQKSGLHWQFEHVSKLNYLQTCVMKYTIIRVIQIKLVALVINYNDKLAHWPICYLDIYELVM